MKFVENCVARLLSLLSRNTSWIKGLEYFSNVKKRAKSVKFIIKILRKYICMSDRNVLCWIYLFCQVPRELQQVNAVSVAREPFSSSLLQNRVESYDEVLMVGRVFHDLPLQVLENLLHLRVLSKVSY